MRILYRVARFFRGLNRSAAELDYCVCRRTPSSPIVLMVLVIVEALKSLARALMLLLWIAVLLLALDYLMEWRLSHPRTYACNAEPGDWNLLHFPEEMPSLHCRGRTSGYSLSFPPSFQADPPPAATQQTDP